MSIGLGRSHFFRVRWSVVVVELDNAIPRSSSVPGMSYNSLFIGTTSTVAGIFRTGHDLLSFMTHLTRSRASPSNCCGSADATVAVTRWAFPIRLDEVLVVWVS